MQVSELKQKFFEFFGEGEVSVYFAPGRVNLIGEHTDYNAGFVFPCALSFGIYCLVRKTDLKVFRFRDIKVPNAFDIALEDLSKPVGKEWVNYPIGVIAQFIKNGMPPKSGLDVMFAGFVPMGAGLSSSAAVEVVTGTAFSDIFGYEVSKKDIALYGQRAEHEYAGVKCGIMDQFISAHGAKDHATFLNCDTLEYELVPVKLDGAKIVISNTNSPHKLESSAYNERVAQCNAAVEAIKPYKNINKLGEISWEEFLKVEDKIADPIARKRARHVVSEIKRTTDAVAALKAGDIAKFGLLMNGSHDSLRDDYDVTGLELDTMVNEGRKIEGVIGTRMTGGGFGGCTVSIVKDEAVDTFIAQVGANYEKVTGLKPLFYVAEIGDGGHKVE